jgi:hypothetical protein
MPEGVIYKNRADAEDYADEVGGIVEEVDEEPKDGVPDGFKVVSPPYRHKGFDPGDLEDPAARQDQADYLAELGRRNMGAKKSSGEAVQFMGDAYVPPDEEGLGYMRHGGMKFKERGTVKYSKGGAVKGKGFAGSF